MNTQDEMRTLERTIALESYQESEQWVKGAINKYRVLVIADTMASLSSEYRHRINTHLSKREEQLHPIDPVDHAYKAGEVMGICKCMGMLDDRTVEEIIDELTDA